MIRLRMRCLFTAGLIWTSANIGLAGSMVLGESNFLSSPSLATQTSVEFYLDLTGADDGMALSVGNYQLRVGLTGAGAGSLVRIIDGGPTLTRPQAFALDTVNVSDGKSIYAATLNLATPFEISDGEGLLRVDLEVLPGATGDYALTVLSGNGDTEFTSPLDFATLLPVGSGSGSISVGTGVEIPEPSSSAAVAAASLLVLSARHRRARTRVIGRLLRAAYRV